MKRFFVRLFVAIGIGYRIWEREILPLARQGKAAPEGAIEGIARRAIREADALVKELEEVDRKALTGGKE